MGISPAMNYEFRDYEFRESPVSALHCHDIHRFQLLKIFIFDHFSLLDQQHTHINGKYQTQRVITSTVMVRDETGTSHPDLTLSSFQMGEDSVLIIQCRLQLDMWLQLPMIKCCYL